MNSFQSRDVLLVFACEWHGGAVQRGNTVKCRPPVAESTSYGFTLIISIVKILKHGSEKKEWNPKSNPKLSCSALWINKYNLYLIELAN